MARCRRRRLPRGWLWPRWSERGSQPRRLGFLLFFHLPCVCLSFTCTHAMLSVFFILLLGVSYILVSSASVSVWGNRLPLPYPLFLSLSFFFYGPFFAWVTVQTSRWDSRSRGAPSRLDSRRTSAARRRHFCTTGLRLHTHHPPGRHAAVKAGTGTGPRQRISSTPLPLHGPPPHHRRNPLLPSLASALAVTPATGLRRPGGALPKSTRDSLTSADSASPVPVCLYGTVHTYIHT